MEALNVYLRGRCIGALISDKGRLSFNYAAAYLSQPDSEALSYTMPLRAEPYHGGEDVSLSAAELRFTFHRGIRGASR